MSRSTTFSFSSSEGPLRPPGVGARVAPFALSAVAVICVVLASGIRQPLLLAAAVAVTALVVLGALLVPWGCLPVEAQCSVPLCFYLAIGLLRAAGGGSTSSAGALSLLPVCWVAMYGGRLALGASLLATAAVFVAPVVLVGGSAYPLSNIGRGATLMLVAAVVGGVVQAAMRALEAQRTAAQTNSRNLYAVAALMHGLRVREDPRSVICEGTLGVAGASMGALLEPHEDGLVVSASAGDAPAPGRIAPARGLDALSLSWSTGYRLTADVLPPNLQPQPAPAEPLRTVLYEPMKRDGHAVGVLVAGWRHRLGPGDPAFDAVGLIATEAAAALGRADLLSALDRSARTDVLTDIANRRAWEEALIHELGRSAPGDHLSVAMLDLDNFKRYNDTYGHPAGDRLLREAAQAWRSSLRDTDTIARYGGEEFAVAMVGCDLEGATALLHQLRLATPRGQTVSAGVAEWDHLESPDALVARVDAALYRAKQEGRDKVCAAELPGSSRDGGAPGGSARRVGADHMTGAHAATVER